MQKRLIELQLERGRLLERIASQRETLARQAEPLTQMFRLGDRVGEALEGGKAFARQHPWAVGLVAALVLVFQPAALLRWAARGATAWRTWKSLQALLPEGLLARLLKLFA